MMVHLKTATILRSLYNKTCVSGHLPQLRTGGICCWSNIY